MAYHAKPGQPYPSSLNYVLHTLIFCLNLAVIVMMGWELLPSVQNAIHPFSMIAKWPLVMIIVAASGVVYCVAVLTLAWLRILIPPLARILFDAIIFIPTYIAGSLVLALGSQWDSLLNPSVGALCKTTHTQQNLDETPDSALESCRAIAKTIAAFNLVAIFIGLTALVLTLIDLIISINVYRSVQRQIRLSVHIQFEKKTTIDSDYDLAYDNLLRVRP